MDIAGIRLRGVCKPFRFDCTGVPLARGDYAVVQLASSELVVVWQSSPPNGFNDIYARIFSLSDDANNAPVAADDLFVVDEDTPIGVVTPEQLASYVALQPPRA